MTDQYCVVVGDVVNSREIEDRDEFRQRLFQAVSTINSQNKRSLYAPFSTLKGIDEIGGVLDCVTPVVTVQKVLTRALHPEQIRLAAVVGTLDIDPGTNDISEMAGSVFPLADAALSELRTNDFTFTLEGQSPMIDELVSTNINTLDMIRNDWSERKMEVAIEYDEFGSQTEVAERLGISKQAVSNHVHSGKIDRVLELEQRLSAIMQSYPSIR